jgi:hypothetical protein
MALCYLPVEEYMIHVKNWEKFQHYKTRNPPWIKLATDTFQNYDFGCLQDASKLLAICCWTLAGRTKDGSIPPDFEWIKKQCCLGDSVTIDHLKELIDKGYIIDASNMLAKCYQSASPETEGEAKAEIKKKVIKKSPPHYSARFLEIYELYPRKDGSKEKAAESYEVAVKSGIQTETIMAGVIALSKYVAAMKTERTYIPHMATWLNQKRWEADYTIPQKKGGYSL